MVVNMPGELHCLRELLDAERAAVRLYNEAIAATRGALQKTLNACRHSHVKRAVYLGGRVSRLGGDPHDETDATLYGARLARIPDEQGLLFAALVSAEKRGWRFYREALAESDCEQMVMTYLRSEQERLLRFVEQHLERAARTRRRSRPPRMEPAPI